MFIERDPQSDDYNVPLGSMLPLGPAVRRTKPRKS